MSKGTRILLIRHATTSKVGKALTGWLPGIPLDEPGREQAKSLVQRLEPTKIDRIYSSPLQRALETAAPLAASRALEITQLPDLGEVNFGDWQGKYLTELEGDQTFHLFNAYRSGTRAPGGELMLETQARVIRTLLQIAADNKDSTVAVFSHADAIKSALMFLLGMPIDFHHRLEIQPASITLVEFYSDIARVLRINVSDSI